MPATILIVEEHALLRQTLRIWLERLFPQERVVAAVSGEEALALVRCITPDVFVVDMGLSGLKGFEAAASLKAAVPTAQVILLTLYEHELYDVAALAAGASACVPRAAIAGQLAATLAGLLSLKTTLANPDKAASSVKQLRS